MDTAKTIVEVVPEDDPTAAPLTMTLAQMSGHKCMALGEHSHTGVNQVAVEGWKLGRLGRLCLISSRHAGAQVRCHCAQNLAPAQHVLKS